MAENDKNMIPLCAAQTHISYFCRQPLTSDFEGKYSFLDSAGNHTFIGGEYVEYLNELLLKECNKIFGATYVNADTLTGINCFTVCAMSLLKRGQRVLLTTPEQGGHASIPIILDTLGVKYDVMPYDYSQFQIDYSRVNHLLQKNIYTYIIFCQSDIINPPDLSKLKIPSNVGIIYDGTQILGLIAGGVVANPLQFNNVVLIGGTHKTLPAPACGLIMTNNHDYKNHLKGKITPDFLRNTQPNHIASLLLSLIEQECYGKEYQSKTIQLANMLGLQLEELGYNVAKVDDNVFSHTHQLFILTDEKDANDFFINAQQYNISLNVKHKKLFKEHGIRLGTQQIARYNWDKEEIFVLSQLLHKTFNLKEAEREDILKLRAWLIERKNPHFECS